MPETGRLRAYRLSSTQLNSTQRNATQRNATQLNSTQLHSKRKLFETSVTSIACFIAGHRNIRQRDVRILVLEIRSLDWCGPYGVCWSSPLAWNVACMNRTSATNPWIQTPTIRGDRLSCDIIGTWQATLRSSTQSLRKHPLQWQPRAWTVCRRPNTLRITIRKFAEWKR